MKKPGFLALVILALTALHLHADPLKVVSWNLEWFPGKRPTASAEDADKHMKDARAELKKLNPDIFVGVEVRDWAAFEELVSVIPGLKTHVVSSFIDPETKEIRPQQIGIASKLTCRAAGWEPWKANVPNISRGFSFVALEQKSGDLLMVYGNHFKSNRGDPQDVATMRDDQAKQLIAQRGIITQAFHDKKIGGVILTGDFNTNHDGQFPLCKVVEEFTAAGYRNTWADTPQEKRLTWRSRPNSEYKPTTFDYFFTYGLGDLKAVMIDTPMDISDHCAIGLAVPQP
ncbi:MAG: endonuclease/exonuclease/phosphatase family protein [Verrucomicrobiota bacterium]